MQSRAVVRQLSEETLAGFIGDGHAPVPILAGQSQLGMADAGKPHVVCGLNHERIHQVAFAVDSHTVGAQQTPRLAAQNSPLADPILAPVLPKPVGLLPRGVEEVGFYVDAQAARLTANLNARVRRGHEGLRRSLLQWNPAEAGVHSVSCSSGSKHRDGLKKTGWSKCRRSKMEKEWV